MAWYDDNKKTTHVATYKNAETAAAEGREAAAKGWAVRETTVAGDRDGGCGAAEGTTAQRRQSNRHV